MKGSEDLSNLRHILSNAFSMIGVNNNKPHASFINKLNILTIFARNFPRSTVLYLLSNVIIHSKYFPVSDW